MISCRGANSGQLQRDAAKVMILLKPDVDIDALFSESGGLTAISQQIGCNGFFAFRFVREETKPMGECFSPGDRGCVEDR